MKTRSGVLSVRCGHTKGMAAATVGGYVIPVRALKNPKRRCRNALYALFRFIDMDAMLQDVLGKASALGVATGCVREDVSFDIQAGFLLDLRHRTGTTLEIPVIDPIHESSHVDIAPLIR